MNIRRKVLILYALTAIGVLSLLLAGAKVILLERFSLLESDEVRLDMDRVLAATGGLLDAMQSVAKDYGNWDDTANYLVSPSDAYIQANFIDATFQNLKLDMVLLADATGKIVYSQGYDLDKKEMRDLPGNWVDVFRAHGFFELGTIQGDPQGSKGLVLTDDGPLMVAVKPVLTSEEKGPPRGVLVMGRLLGQDEVDRLSQLALIRLSWLKLHDLPVDMAQMEAEQPSSVAKAPVAVRPLSSLLVEGLSLVRGMGGEPIGAWRIELDRQLYLKGMTGTVYFLAVMVAGGIVFTVFFAVILERVVLGRIASLSEQVERIAGEGDLSGRVEAQGEDEIGELSAVINGMLDGLAKNASELRAIAEELRVARDAAEQASQAKSRFLATMSHEIRTPLNALSGFTELACDEDAGENLPEYLEDIRSASDHLRNLIEDILDFSKIEAGRLVLESSPFNVGRLAEETGILFRTLARAKGLAFDMAVDQDVRTTVLGDSLRLRQVLSNLLDNAVKFTESGTVSLRALVTRDDPGHIAVRFEVADTGIGISRTAMAGVFSPFSQEDSSTTRRFGGTGLGRAICREIVALMGSGLDVESTPGKGARFHFEVRFEKAAELMAAPREGVPQDLAGASIRVAEDNACNRKSVKQMLEGAGAVAVLAENGKQAVLAALERELDLVIMDMHMPEMDGLEAARVLRGHACCRDLPIIALTAGALAGDREKCLEAGMNDYLTKPVSRRDLLESVGKWLRKSPASTEGNVDASYLSDAPETASEESLPPLEGVDLGKALTIYEGRAELLTKILGQFPNSFRDACPRMRTMIDRGDVKEAWMAAHGLKGAAASIAATEAAALAKALEDALAGNDVGTAQKLLAELDPVLLSLFDRIEDFLAAYSRAHDTTEL